MLTGDAPDLTPLVDLVRRSRGERGRPAFGWDSLTPTELAVLGLVAEGLTNPEIATANSSSAEQP
ncbi:MAG: LuxR C-terminal-related transcriptional regulator [Microthrixaceae bacterium]